MPVSWKLSARLPRPIAEAGLAALEENEVPVAISEAQNGWLIEAWFADEPDRARRAALGEPFAIGPDDWALTALPDTDWVGESQRAVAPVNAGRFRIRTPDHEAPAIDEDTIEFVIPAAQAFGTGHHPTTIGCLEALDRLERNGVAQREVADIGSGTGLLAFAALRLWPEARAIATDIDPVCIPAMEENAARNRVPVGDAVGGLTILRATGTDDETIHARAPFDLVIANILAGPLIELAPDFATIAARDGRVLLAGLLSSQADRVRRAYEREGFALERAEERREWTILLMRRAVR